VADQAEHRHVARGARLQPSLLVGHPLGLAGEHAPVLVEEPQEGAALVALVGVVVAQLRHCCSNVGTIVARAMV
jgi:hypothetical protein